MEALLIALVLVMVFIVVVALGVATVAWAVDHSNRVSPDTSSPAPLVWIWSPSRPARLHRRLQAAVAPIHVPTPRGRAARRASLPPAGSVPALCMELEAQAVEIDRHIRLVSRYPRGYRMLAMRQLDHDVRQVEQISLRLRRMSRPVGSPSSGWDRGDTPPEVLQRLGEDLDRLEHAQAELDHIERTHGLVSDDVLREIDERARAEAASPPVPDRDIRPSLPPPSADTIPDMPLPHPSQVHRRP